MDEHRPETLASLTDDQRAAYFRLVEQFTRLEADDPEGWALSEVTENIPQLARFLVLRHLWKNEIDKWTADSSWMQDAIRKVERDPTGFFADAGLALRRLIAIGASTDDLARIARFVAYASVFDTLNAIDSGGDLELGDDYPGWTLVETTGVDETVTGRYVAGLHESLLSMDPSGREGRPEQ